MHLHLKAAFGGAGRLNPATKRKNSLSEIMFTLLAHPRHNLRPKSCGVPGCGALDTAGSLHLEGGKG